LGSKKLASAPPYGGAREPGSYTLVFHQDRANKPPEQTQKRIYSRTTSALQHGGDVKKFLLGG